MTTIFDERTRIIGSDGEIVSIETPLPVGTDPVSDAIASMEIERILGDILTELKIITFHLSLITDTTIKKTEVE